MIGFSPSDADSLNSPEPNYHDLLQRFEDRNRSGERITPFRFISELSISVTQGFILEILAIDIELSLTRGLKPSLQKYLSDFPYLGDEIPDLFVSVINTFIKNFCPVRRSLGGLKNTPEYDIEKEIGRGGMGVVYQATQRSIGRKVALKVLFFAREDIFREARKVAVLNHPNICKIYDAGKIGDFPFMAMQLIRGESLDQRMEHRRLSISEAVSTISQIADGLSAAHRSNLVHFDVKPENILVSADGYAWLMDFGLAKKPSEMSMEAGGMQPFSFVFSAPEQLSLQYGERGFRSDIYSLGLVLYFLLTGRRAYDGSMNQIMDQIRHDPPRRPSDYDPNITPELEAICLKAIRKDPGERYSSITEMRDQLANLL